MKSNPTIKILIGYHKPSVLFKSNLLVPVQGGRAIAEQASKDGTLQESALRWLLNNTIGDDSGENMSVANRYINEMSIIYWGWKNYQRLNNPDYMGFMQYAKHMVINPYMEIPARPWLPHAEMYICDVDWYKKQENLSEKWLKAGMRGYDIICPESYDVAYTGSANCKLRLEVLAPGYGGQVFNIMSQYIRKHQPEMIPYLKELETGSVHYPLNCFIMKKDLFFSYCNFVFDVLKAVMKKTDFSQANIRQQRAPAYLSELLTSMFIRSCDKKYRIKKCKTVVLVPPASATKPIPRELKDALFYQNLKWQYLRCRLLAHLTWGKKKQHYVYKKNQLRQRVRCVNAWIK